jgi:hypothetical protein
MDCRSHRAGGLNLIYCGRLDQDRNHLAIQRRSCGDFSTSSYLQSHCGIQCLSLCTHGQRSFRPAWGGMLILRANDPSASPRGGEVRCSALPRVELPVQPVGRAPAFVQFSLPVLCIESGRDQENAEAGSGPQITYPKHCSSYHVDTRGDLECKVSADIRLIQRTALEATIYRYGNSQAASITKLGWQLQDLGGVYDHEASSNSLSNSPMAAVPTYTVLSC